MAKPKQRRGMWPKILCLELYASRRWIIFEYSRLVSTHLFSSATLSPAEFHSAEKYISPPPWLHLPIPYHSLRLSEDRIQSRIDGGEKAPVWMRHQSHDSNVCRCRTRTRTSFKVPPEHVLLCTHPTQAAAADDLELITIRITIN